VRLTFSLLAALAAETGVRPVRTAELPEALRRDGWLEAIGSETQRRLRDGEWDHLIHYALQSNGFTSLPPVEPALAAKQWKETGRIPEAAAARLKAFAEGAPATERHREFRAMLTKDSNLEAEFARAMAFLFEKEWASRSRQGQARRDFVASLYQRRGHSTDTDPRATFGVHVGLEMIRRMSPGIRIRRVLVAGPGLDRAPRTALREDLPVQTYQPYALADSLVRLGLAVLDDLEVDCVDINPRVVGHINRFPRSDRTLRLRYPPGDAAWNVYFTGLGERIGSVSAERGLHRVDVNPGAASRVRAFEMNVLTQRIAEKGRYDLAVATNILVYFDDRETGLALANILHALGPGGYLLHNDPRPAIETWSRLLALPVVDARMVRTDPARHEYDTVVLHRAGGGGE